MKKGARCLGIVGVVGVAWMVGCGGQGAKAPPASPAESYPPATATMDSPKSAGAMPMPAEAAPMAPPASMAPMPAPVSAPSGSAGEASASRSAPRDEAEVAPSKRPGLGTEWGETRQSHVSDVAFLRADEDKPFAIASLHYDDRKGVDAQASYHARTSPWMHEVPTASGAISVSVRDGRGAPLDARRVNDRTYVVGRAGERYVIVLTNHTRHRFEAVATVDGLDVINGRAGSLENRGYLLQPFSSVEIDGFRQSSDAVAAFRFGKVGESYAAQTGSARDVGVIGVAFFTERGDRFEDDAEARTRDTANPFPADDRYARPPTR